MAEANIRAVITARDEASAVLDSFGSKVGNVAKLAGEALLGAGAAAVGFGALSLKAYAESEAAGAQVNQVLETTGKISSISAKQVEDLAMAMERYSGKTHDSIEAGQTILLQFKEVTAKTLPDMTKLMLDLSQRMGIDNVAAAKTLGLALDDPTLGLTRLRRAGVDFTDQQKEQIKSMQASGNMAGAQAILMSALESKVGGAAGAYRNTLGGSLESIKSSFKDLEIRIGEHIAKGLEPLTKKAAEALSKIDWGRVIDNTINALKEFGNWITNAWKSIEPFRRIVEQVAGFLINLFTPAFEGLYNAIKTHLIPVIEQHHNQIIALLKIAAVFEAVFLGSVVLTFYLIINVVRIAIDVFTFLINVITNVINWFRDLPKHISAFVASARNDFNSLPGIITTAVSGLVGIITAPFVTAFNIIKNGIADVVNAFKNLEHLVTSSPKNIVHSVGGFLDKLNPFAEGTDFAPGGLALVGEKGPEIINLPRGSQVIPNKQLGNLASNNTGSSNPINITVQAGAFMGSPQDARQYAKLILNALQDVASSKGMSFDQLWRHNGIRSI